MTVIGQKEIKVNDQQVKNLINTENVTIAWFGWLPEYRFVVIQNGHKLGLTRANNAFLKYM